MGKSDVATLKQYVDILPQYLTRRFISAEQDAVLVSGRVPDVDASQLLPIIQSLDKALDQVRAQHPGDKIAVTGLSAIAARNSALMIEKLNRGLTLEFLFVAAFIGLAFRSLVVMLACIMPGIFPVVLSGTMLWLIGEGLQFASVVALTVSFGLGLSATIHFLNRLRHEERPDEDPAIAVERATRACWPTFDSDLGRARLRSGGNDVLRSAVAAPVRLVERVRHACGVGCGPLDPAADGYLLEQARTPAWQQMVAPAGTGGVAER
jgi:predicted RND superfamily exporter protein